VPQINQILSLPHKNCTKIRSESKEKTQNFKGGFFGFFKYFIQHCFIFRPSESNVKEDAGLNPGLLQLWHWQSEALTTQLDLNP
jgi:hypothetical protein